eukprot:m.71582 g.71582  ORF g.71582 m.71582 type:complete len:105 (-) comp14222_c0_seq4:1877-2191(-)
MAEPRDTVANAVADAHIVLEPVETRVFELFKAVACSLEGEHGSVPTMRVAGGWIRDKLLGLQSLDIDITLDIMSGRAFAMAVEHYVQSKVAHLSCLNLCPDALG